MRIRVRWVVLSLLLVGFGWAGREGYRAYRVLGQKPAPPPPVPVLDAQSRRAIAQGEVVGARNALGAHVYRGIPFAQPPVGPLRWKAPRPPARFSGVREAVARAPVCVQPNFDGGTSRSSGAEGREDCLYLDVYAKAMTASEARQRRLPVMFWIHGGANLVGAAGETDASRLALEHDVVVVMPNYRLGPLGWFSHPALRAGTEPAAHPGAGTPLEASAAPPSPPDPLQGLDHSGNYGTLDLVQALRWVQENVASFGGDPGKVTIFGVSAGGANVLSLLLSPLAKGLFHGAISESGVIYSHAMTEAEADVEHGGHGSSSTEVLLRLLVADGRAKDREAAKAVALTMGAAETASYLRAQPGKALLEATLRPRPTGDDRPPEFPTVLRDGTVIPEGPALEQYASGNYHRVPTILGTNRDEMKAFMVGNPELVKARVPSMIQALDDDFYALLAEYRSEAWRAGTVHALAPAMRKVQGTSVFGYRFDWDEQPRILLTDLSLLVGAGHGLEVPFLFGTFDSGGRSRFMFTEDNREGREALSAAMRSYWAEFAHTGRPGAGRSRTLRPWKAWGDSDDAEKFLVLDTQEGGGVRMERAAPTVPDLLARLKNDSRLPETRDKCRVLYWLTHRGRSVERKRYFDLEDLSCKAFPPERYPWPAR